MVSSGGFGPGTLPPGLAQQVANLPGVSSTVGVGLGTLTIRGQSEDLTISDPPALARLIDLGHVRGSLADVGSGAIAISAAQAKESRTGLGDSIAVQYPDGARADLVVKSIYENADLYGDYLVSDATWRPHTGFQADSQLFVKVADGTPVSSVRSELKGLTRNLGHPDIQDRKEYTDSIAGRLNQLLGLVIVMLALAIVIALMGIANTLALSVHERSREIGVLRSVGTTRRQLRRIIRWESVIIAVFGTIGGISLGLLLGWGLVSVAFADAAVPAFAVPTATLVITVLVGVVAGVLAAARPARRAARQDVLAAIASA